MGLTSKYNAGTIYVHDDKIHTCHAAKVILPMTFSQFHFESILDVGCGIGTWLKTAKEFGIKDVVGVDGNYVDRKMLLISEAEFVPHNLTKGLNLYRQFDLCICLEVAEHLPENAAAILIETLITHSDVILFSAAIPGQGGQHHINEQWPSYWEQKFAERGYIMKDFFRSKIWMNESVDRWYRQNLFLVVKKGHILSELETPAIFPLVHPDVFTAIIEQHKNKIRRLNYSVDKLKSRDILSLIKRTFKRK